MTIDHLCVNYGAKLFQELFLELRENKIEQNVFYPRNKSNVINNSEQAYKVDSPLVLSLLTKVSFHWKRQIMKKHYDPLFQRNNPDIIHAHTLFSDGSLANYYFKKVGTPFLVAVRSTDLDVFLKFKPWLKPHGKQILDNAKYIVFITPSLKTKFQRIYGGSYESKSLIIPNGINTSYLSSENTQHSNFHSPLELLYVGSFLKRKHVPSLIDLAERYKAKLTIVGKGGDEEKRVLQMIRDSDWANYLGHIERRSRLTEIYKAADIFIMTSTRETFGLVYIEAMSQGLPVIYSKNTGIDGLFEPGSVGFGVTPGLVSEMMHSIDKILFDYQDISKRCVLEARKLNWTSLAKRYLKIYNTMMN